MFLRNSKTFKTLRIYYSSQPFVILGLSAPLRGVTELKGEAKSLKEKAPRILNLVQQRKKMSLSHIVKAHTRFNY